MRSIPGKDVRRCMPFCGFESHCFLTLNQEMDNVEKDLDLMFTDRLHKWYNYLPEPKRFYIFFFGLGVPVVLLAAWNIFIGVPAITIIILDRMRFLKKFEAR